MGLARGLRGFSFDALFRARPRAALTVSPIPHLYIVQHPGITPYCQFQEQRIHAKNNGVMGWVIGRNQESNFARQLLHISSLEKKLFVFFPPRNIFCRSSKK